MEIVASPSRPFVINFFINLLAAFYGLIGFFSIIPFLLVMFLFGFSFIEPSQIQREAYIFLLLGLGWTSSAGVLIIFLVHRFHDLGRKLMIADSIFFLFLLLFLVWRGRIGERVLTQGNNIALGIIISLFTGAVLFLFHVRARKFFNS